MAQAPARLKEALKLGFAKAVTPQGRGEGGEGALATEALRHIADMVAGIASGGPRRVGARRGHNPPITVTTTDPAPGTSLLGDDPLGRVTAEFPQDIQGRGRGMPHDRSSSPLRPMK